MTYWNIYWMTSCLKSTLYIVRIHLRLFSRTIKLTTMFMNFLGEIYPAPLQGNMVTTYWKKSIFRRNMLVQLKEICLCNWNELLVQSKKYVCALQRNLLVQACEIWYPFVKSIGVLLTEMMMMTALVVILNLIKTLLMSMMMMMMMMMMMSMMMMSMMTMLISLSKL